MTPATTGLKPTGPKPAGPKPTGHRRTGLAARSVAAAAILCAALLPDPAAAEATDCANPKTTTEKEVCADEELHTLGELITRYLAAALPALDDGAPCLEADQQKWQDSVRDACGGDVPCQAEAFRRRLDQLDKLLTAVPPSPEMPETAGGEPFEVTGKLLWEQQDINNMGLAVRDEKGALHVIVLDMDMGSSSTHDAIRSAIASSTSTAFTVRGTRSPDGGFAMDQCRIVWRAE